jgi:tripartite-type tricarboxylate transporter receptor subunit TctC
MSGTVLARIAALLCALLPTTFTLNAQAQGYPSKPVRVIIPYPPGNTADIVARLVSIKLTERLGQNVVIDNRAGASGQIGLEATMRSPADGYTLTVGQAGNFVVAPHTYKKLSYDPLKDFTPVAQMATNYLALVVHPATPFKTPRDLVTYARANPGKLVVGTNGEGGFPHLSMELLRTQAGFTYLHVPYKGSGQIAIEIIGGQVDACMEGYTAMAPYIRSGKLRLLGISAPQRDPALPDLPTIGESIKGYESLGWFGFFAPAGTPREVVALLNKTINEATSAPDVREKMLAAGLTPINATPEAYGVILQRDYAKFGKLVKAIGFQPQ